MLELATVDSTYDPKHLKSSVIQVTDAHFDSIDSHVHHGARRGAVCGYVKAYSYENHTPDTLRIIAQDGIPVDIPSEAGNRCVNPYGYANRLVIRVYYQIKQDVRVDPFNQLAHEGEDREDVKQIQRILSTNPAGMMGEKTHQFEIIYTITADELYQKGGYVYLQDLGLVVCNWSAHDCREYGVYHPATDAYAKRSIMVGNDHINSKKRFSMSMFIVANQQRIDDKYINVAGNIFTIPSIEDPNLRDGFYVCHDTTATVNNHLPPPTAQRLPIEQAIEKYRLFDTVESAEKLGDPNKQLEIEQHKHKERRLELEKENANLKEQIERDKIERENKLHKIKHEREARSYQRKERSEILRYIPAILTGIFSVFTVIIRWWRG